FWLLWLFSVCTFMFLVQMSSGSSDDDFTNYDDETHMRPHLGGRLIPPMECGYQVRKFDRPLPVKEDLVAYVTNGRTKIGYVSKVSYKDRSGSIEHRTEPHFHIDEIPSLRVAHVSGSEAITIDRCYSVGETVMAFRNKHQGTAQAINRCYTTTMIGQILAVRTSADVMVLPEKKIILKDVPIDNNYKMLEMMNFNSSHNYILFKDWVGDIIEMDNEIVCWYNKQRVTLIESSKHESFFRRIGELRRSNKAFIPGETVYVELRNLTSKHAKWESGEVPANLKKKMQASHYSGDQKVRLVIEKVVAHSIGVRWLQSPSSMTMPSTKIGKGEMGSVIMIDVSANPRISSADRMLFTLENEVRKMSKKEFNQWLANEYKSWFVKPQKTPKKKKTPAVSSELSAVLEEEEEMKSVKDEEEEEMEVDEQATGDNADKEEGDEEEMEEKEKEKVHLPVSAAVRGGNRLKRGRMPVRTVRETRSKKTAPFASSSQPDKKKKDGKWTKGVFIGEIALSRTMCDVEWMDGTITKDVMGASLVPVDPDLDQQDHLPGNVVARKSEDESGYDDFFGIILRVNPEERVATVRWFKLIDRTRVNGGAEHTEDEEVTLFDIMLHPYYKRQFPGYLGVCLNKSGPDLRSTCCKILANLQNGKQLVEYFDSASTKDELWPMEIMPLALHEHDDESDVSDNYHDDAMEFQTQQSLTSSTAATAGTSASGTGSSINGNMDDVSGPSSSSSSRAHLPSSPAIKLSLIRPTTRSSAKKKKRNEEEEEKEEELVPKSLPMFEKGTLTMLDGEVTIGHKYLNEPVINPGRSWIKAVMREHAHLMEHLPKEIHLWAWETRLDLLTCVIFGPSGTPFELTPFHFDIHIPETFPAVPPKVHYYSWSQEQLNPNLYQAGKVCVSLLGTWDGDGAEKWTPTSNLLQVFISIQGLILNAEPYFNEAGYEERKNVPEHEANSKRYNETAAINSLEYMWRIYDRPPEHISSVVRQGVDAGIGGFKKRVMEWSDGKKEPEFPVHCSKGFRLALKTTMSKVVSILNKHQSPPIV
ncbi:hypothetical protein PENTCL1PPCAC_11779, partial [Pristionchus entomophagus]